MGWDAEGVGDREDDTVSTGQVSGMGNREAQRRLLQERIRWAEANLKEAREKLAKLEWPKEPGRAITGDIPVILFDFEFHAGSKRVTFAGLRASNGMWYIPGGTVGRTGRTWEELMEWIETHGEIIGPIRYADSFRDLSP